MTVMTFSEGQWVVLPEYGVARVQRITSKHRATPGKKVYVLVVDAPSLTLGRLDEPVMRAEAHQTGEELIVPVDSEVAKALRPVVSRDEAIGLRALLEAPPSEVEPLPRERIQFLKAALLADLAFAIGQLRRWRANPPDATSFVERQALAALESVIAGELAIALGEASRRVRLLHEQASAAARWTFESVGGQPAIKIVAHDGSSRISTLADDEHGALQRLLA